MRTAIALECEHVSTQLSDAASTGTDLADLDEATRLHVEHCLRCQAELVQYRKLFRALRALRTEVLEPAPGLVAEILLALEDAGERSALRGMLSGRKVVYIGGLAAAATAAGVGSAIVVASRTRRRLLAS